MAAASHARAVINARSAARNAHNIAHHRYLICLRANNINARLVDARIISSSQTRSHLLYNAAPAARISAASTMFIARNGSVTAYA